MTNRDNWEFVHHSEESATWTPGLRKIFDYRDLGIKDGTNGDFVAHVIRRNQTESADGVQSWHVHNCSHCPSPCVLPSFLQIAHINHISFAL